MVLNPGADPFGDPGLAEEMAGALGARFVPVEGMGHFWPYTDAERGAAILEDFWSSLG